MTKRTTLRIISTSLFLFMAYSGVAQQQQPLQFVAMHQVDEAVFAHTYKIDIAVLADQKDDQQLTNLPNWIAALLNELNATTGTLESSYDAATGTITVITSTEASLQPIFDRIK